MRKKKAFTMIEMIVVVGIMAVIATFSIGFIASFWINIGDGRAAGDALRSVEGAQRRYFADHPGDSLSALTTTKLNPYMPTTPGSDFSVLLPTSLQKLGVTIDVTTSPPVLRKSGAVYDPSGNSADGNSMPGNRVMLKINKLRGSVILEAIIATAIISIVSYVSAQSLYSAILHNRWGAAQAIAESAIDIEASRARQLYPSQFEGEYPSTGVRSVTKTLGTVGGKSLVGTFRYTSRYETLQPNGARRTRLIVVLEFSVNKNAYLKSREVSRYEGI